MRIEATFQGRDTHGHILLKDLSGDVVRDHGYLNGTHSNFPDGIKPGSRVRFYCSPLRRKGKEPRMTDIRECRVIA